MSYLVEIVEGDSPYSVMVEEDDRVAYAYLRDDAAIVSDVWLYNVAPAPERPEWTEKGAAPFLNPRSFVREEPPPKVPAASDVRCRWYRDNHRLLWVEVEIHDVVYGRLAPGERPGWARLAKSDGPLAKVLEQETVA